jgi:hypothetical protein
MCILELVDYNEAMMGGGETAKAKTTRRRRSPKKKDETVTADKAPKAVKTKAEKKEAPVIDKEVETAGESVPEV